MGSGSCWANAGGGEGGAGKGGGGTCFSCCAEHCGIMKGNMIL